jgi:hypothetical protein
MAIMHIMTAVDSEINVAWVEEDCDKLAFLGNMSLGQPKGLENQFQLFEAIGIL